MTKNNKNSDDIFPRKTSVIGKKHLRTSDTETEDDQLSELYA